MGMGARFCRRRHRRRHHCLAASWLCCLRGLRYGPGCYWASRPVYDGAGRVVGYTGPLVQVCPGYSGGPSADGLPGYAGGPPAGGPPRYAGGAPAGDPVASCVQRFRSYDPKTGTYLGNDGQRHSCP
jgi:hypothetical protein